MAGDSDRWTVWLDQHIAALILFAGNGCHAPRMPKMSCRKHSFVSGDHGIV